MPNTKLAAAALAASLLAGGTAGALLSAPMTAMAAETSGETTSRANWISDALKKLVDAGTISKGQSDAVAKALAEARPQHRPRRVGARMSLDAAAKALGISGSELRDEMVAGKTIAQVASERGVDVQVVIDAMVADFRAHLAEHVASGRLTQAQADARAAVAAERVTTMVNNEIRLRGQRHHRGQPGSSGGRKAPAAGAETAPAA